jgi:leader peptidase (prepilin peptidase)/N-methyltransferase
VDALLVASTSVAGLVIGGALDPWGQRMADRSRLDAERRRAEQEASTERDDLDRPLLAEGTGSHEETVRHLLPAGKAPARTLLAALLTGVLFGSAASHFGRDLILAPFCVFFAMLVALSVTDLTHRLVPRWLLYEALALITPLLVATAAVDDDWHQLTGSVIAGGVAFVLFLATWWFVPRGMGFGDVRLAGVIGLTVGYLSLLHAYVAFLAGFVIGTLCGVAAMLVSSSAGRKTRIPFAPSLAVGAVIAVLWGGQIAQHLFHAGS